jgi:hypothetical protein
VKMSVHPTSGELLAAATNPDCHALVAEHLDECILCRVLLTRLRASGAFSDQLDADQQARLMAASPSLPSEVTTLVSTRNASPPRRGELWRVVGSQGMLVWVRRLVDDRTVDVIPVTLDTEMSDERTLLVPSTQSPLELDLGAMVDLRTFVHRDTFENRLGSLQIADDVEALLANGDDVATTHAVGPPIDHEADQRLEYRHVLRTLLSDLSPSAREPETGDQHENSHRQAVRGYDSVPGDELRARLRGIRLLDIPERGGEHRDVLTPVMKAIYLDTAVLICRFRGDDPAWGDYESVALHCRRLATLEDDSDAIAVFRPDSFQLALLFTRADLREAIGLPSGTSVPPSPWLEGVSLTDALIKYFDGSLFMGSWSADYLPVDGLHGDLTQRSRSHAEACANQLMSSSLRARQGAKRLGWSRAGSQVDLVVDFVQALSSGDVDSALGLLEDEPQP